MKIVVFGNGFLGNRIAKTIPGAQLSHAKITDRISVQHALRGADAVVNAAGKTGRPNVDWCESNVAETLWSNVAGAVTLAEECVAAGVHLIHLGSGCVFYGRSPHQDGAWREGDFANSKSVYSRSKYAADLALSCFPGVAIVRLRMPVDGVPGPRNLITKLAGYKQVIDVENSITVVDDLVEVVRQLAERRATGIFHATNTGVVSHRQILGLYRELVDPTYEVEFIGEDELVSRGLAIAPRSNCVLASTRLEEIGIRMPDARESLRKAMEQYAREAKK